MLFKAIFLLLMLTTYFPRLAAQEIIEDITIGDNYEENEEWKFEGKKSCIIDFYAEWCSPCMMLKPHVELLAEDNKDEVEVLFVNVDDNRELAKEFGVKNIPALFLYKDGELVEDRTMGKTNLKEKISEYLKGVN